jgi:raffinose/stachyose/melibiose transport system substrate-binding protein
LKAKRYIQASSIAITTMVIATSAHAAPSCGTNPVVLNSYFETGFPLPTELSKEFTKQFPNVTFNIAADRALQGVHQAVSECDL